MVKLHKIHKFFGIFAGMMLLLLGATGFILDHADQKWLYQTTLRHFPDTLRNYDRKLITAYIVDKKDILVGSKRGLFISHDEGKHFKQIANDIVFTIKKYKTTYLVATQNGLQIIQNDALKPFALKKKKITALACTDDTIIAVEEKKWLYLFRNGHWTSFRVSIPATLLHHPITLARLVRDLHYGRGLVTEYSKTINDYGALWLSWLAVSGFIIFIVLKISPKKSKSLIKMHANMWAFLAIFPIAILCITGIVLDHAKALSTILHRNHIAPSFLPPVYRDLHDDIWDVAVYNNSFYIGNRVGLFKTPDFVHYTLISKGFVYKLFKDGNVLIISGMGAPSRIVVDDKEHILHAPHMFKAYIKQHNRIIYYTPRSSLSLPHWHDITLYSIILGIHDGNFFASWWKWINDLAAIAALILAITGSIRWIVMKKRKSPYFIANANFSKVFKAS